MRSILLCCAAALALAACSSDDGPAAGRPDAGPDDADKDCVAMQRAYVERVAAGKTSVADQVTAVMAAPDFATSMPYCSGERPR